jgi:hypothetical protein
MGGQLAHPWLPATLYEGLGAWMSPSKIKDKKYLTELHNTSLSSVYSHFLSYPLEMSRGKWQYLLYKGKSFSRFNHSGITFSWGFDIELTDRIERYSGRRRG